MRTGWRTTDCCFSEDAQNRMICTCRTSTEALAEPENNRQARLNGGQPRDWRHRGMGKGLVSERDLDPHVCDLRLCVPRPYREAHNRRSGTCMCVRGPTRTLRT